MEGIKRTRVDEGVLDQLLGLESSKIGFYAEVKQKIQELEAANLGLRTKKSELQAVFDAIGDSIVIYDANGLVEYRNHITPRFFPKETLVGKSCRALFHPEQRSAPESCPVGQALNGKSVQFSFSSGGSGGESRYFDASATPIVDPSGKNRVLLFIRDVTDKRHQEIQLLQSEKMSSIGVLAAGVAHEINNPLTSVAGYAEALVRRFRETPEFTADDRLNDFPHYLDVIVREAYRCKGIINSLLSFSRKSDGRMGTVDVNLLIREILELVRLMARHENIEIAENLQADLPPVTGDATALRQVFMNLVMNALHAVGDGGGVAISSGQEDGEVLIRVKDTGIGIPEEVLEQIWTPFFTTKEVGQGSGLGLAVSYNIVKKHRGEIEVESREGEGSQFTVRLPLCQEK